MTRVNGQLSVDTIRSHVVDCWDEDPTLEFGPLPASFKGEKNLELWVV